MSDDIIIPMFEIESSNIKAAGYHQKAKILRIKFKGTATYDFFHVPPELFKSFMAAESKGRFFFTNIKGKFDSAKTNIPAK